MKKIINIIIGLFCMSTMALGQQTTNMPSTAAAPPATQTPVLPPNYTGNIILNAVRTIELKHPAVTEADVNSARTANKTMEQTVYSDGFMRPLQVVIKKNSGTGAKDMVYHYNYDATTGLVKRDLLPFAKQDVSAGSENQFTKSVQTDLTATYAQLGYANEPFLYTETMYEEAMRALPLQKRAQGNAWAGRSVGARSSTRALLAADNLQRFTVAYPQSSVPVLQTTGYALNEVTVSISIDEDLNESKTFTTADGDMVAMEKNGVRTYYVYDFYHRQRYVLTPKALEEFATLGWVMDMQVMNNLCFRYEYDQRGNQVLIKKPGIGATEFRYNQQDQVVLSQDAAQQAQGKWVFHKYDIRGRLIQQGLFTGANVGQPVVDPSPDGSNVAGASGGGPSLSLLDYLYYKKIYSSADYEYNFPNTEFLIHYYFDDYSFKDRLVALGTYSLPQLAFIGAVANATEGYDEAVTENTQGLLTGVHMAVSNNARWLAKVNYYNSRGELIQTIADDLRPRFNITGFGYDYSGNLVKSVFQNNDLTIQKKYVYDTYGRLTFIKHKIGNSGDYRQIAQYLYDDLGRMKTKYLGAMQYRVQYEYNIRNWVVGINRNYVNDPNSTTYFGEELFYESGYEHNYLNGRLAGIRWRSTGTNKELRSYGYLYDDRQMLKKADYYMNQQPPNTVAVWGKEKDFTTDDLTYDANGNILSMTHFGLDASHNAIILDKLSYVYAPQSNQLQAVDEDQSSGSVDPGNLDGLGDFRDVPATTDYLYDANGNITTDLNRNAGNINSNWFTLNKPLHVELLNQNKSVDYVYDAMGNLLTKTIHWLDPYSNQPQQKVVEYVGDAVYEDGKAVMLNHDEGRVRFEELTSILTVNSYDYYLKDHLENIRCIITESAEEGGEGEGGDPGGGDGPGATLPNEPIGYIATSEINNQPWETQLFERVDETRGARPGVPQSGNQFAANLTAASTAVLGPGKLIKVMAGDKIQLGAEAFYQSVQNPAQVVPLQTIVGQLVTAIAGAQATLGETAGLISQADLTPTQLANTLTDLQDDALTDTTQPKAYLNYLVFDEAFNINHEASGALQVQQANAWQNMDVAQFDIGENGYVYVFTSNQSLMSVRTDNLYLYHWQSRVLEEMHYYPFGLTFEVSTANNLTGSDVRYNSQSLERNEFSDANGQTFGLNWYDFMARSYDMQLGRWMQPDPLMQHASPYLAMSNNPTLFTDPSGLWDGYDDGPKPVKVRQSTKSKDPSLDGERRLYEPRVSGSRKNGFMLDNGKFWWNFGGVGGEGDGPAEMDMDGGQQIQYDQKVLDEYARIKANQAQEAAYGREYRSYGWSHQQNIAASKLYLNGVSMLFPVGRVAGGIARTLGLGNVLAKIGSIGKLFGGASTGTQGVNRIYSARELVRRAAESGPFHNFPESFNQAIFSGSKTITPNFFNIAKPGLSNTNILYQMPGTINGTKGVFEIGVRPSLSGNTEVIMHRFFKPY